MDDKPFAGDVGLSQQQIQTLKARGIQRPSDLHRFQGTWSQSQKVALQIQLGNAAKRILNQGKK